MRTVLLLLALSALAAGSGAALWFFIYRVDPAAMDAVAWLAFYGLICLGVASVAALVSLASQRLFGRPLTAGLARDAFRHGLLLGFLLAAFFALKQTGFLTYVTGGAVAIFTILIEAFSNRRRS